MISFIEALPVTEQTVRAGPREAQPSSTLRAHSELKVSSQDVLTAGLLATLHHEVGISAGAAPLAFNAFCVGASANDGVSVSVSGGIEHHPHIVGDISGMASSSASHALLGLPGIEHLTAHEAWAAFGANDYAVLQHVEHCDTKSFLGFLGDAMVGSGCHGFQGVVPSRAEW